MKYISLENLQTYNTEIKKYIDIKSDYEEFVGTKEEWDALSEEEKEKYKDGIVNIIDDFVPSGGEGGGMLSSDYDSDNSVKSAGGIKPYVETVLGGIETLLAQL